MFSNQCFNLVWLVCDELVRTDGDLRFLEPVGELLPEVVELLGLLVAALEVAGALGAARHDLLPAVLDARQQVLDEDHVLLLAEVLQVGAHFVQRDHCLTVLTHVLLQHLKTTQIFKYCKYGNQNMYMSECKFNC